jgi:hypothetical protein
MAPKKKTEIQELSEFIRDHMVTKDDLKNFATKDDLKKFPTKDDGLAPISWRGEDFRSRYLM